MIFLYRTTYDKYNRDYFSGLEANLKAMSDLYGLDWTLRLYYQIPKKSPTWPKLCKLVCSNPNIDICSAEHIPKFSKTSTTSSR